MIDELTRERLGRELRSAAGQIRLEPGSELTVVKTGRKRRRRRRPLRTPGRSGHGPLFRASLKMERPTGRR